MMVSDAVLLEHHVLVATDNELQRRARLLQALLREARGMPIGVLIEGTIGITALRQLTCSQNVHAASLSAPVLVNDYRAKGAQDSRREGFKTLNIPSKPMAALTVEALAN